MNLSFIQDKDVCGILILADREADNDNRWMMVLISADLSACHMGGESKPSAPIVRRC